MAPLASRTSLATRKRTLALANRDELDLSSLPVTLEILEAMRTRIIELEDELAPTPPNETCSNEHRAKRA
ncbi:hypothetical protein BYT27DRAFT_7201853 [Phlegmacium glaucopus]|nr:hypothetical protein BYT27DRAFT_7201853 [Phlegmacium glaucopus]